MLLVLVNLEGLNSAEWKTHTPDSYSCKWMHSRTRTYIHFKMVAYPARLNGENKYLQQHLTHTKCRYAPLHCRPREMRHSQIVWHRIKHDSRLYHSLGNFKVHQLDNFILVPSLSISGTITSTRHDSAVLFLDTGYVLLHVALLNGTLANVEKHVSALNQAEFIFDRKNKLEIENNRFQHFLLITDLLVTHVAALIEHERTNMINAWENICRERQKLSRIYRWAIENFPHTSSQWFTQFPGHVVQPHGDAYVLSQCFNVTNYVIYWNRTYNNTCYSNFPVYIVSEQHIKYLSIIERRLQSPSPVISCHLVPQTTYIADQIGTLWLIDQNGTASAVNYSTIFLPAFSNSILRLGNFNSRLLQFVSEPFDTFSLLDILAQSQETLEELENIRQNDEDSGLALGIGKIIGSTLSGISSGGSHIIKAVGTALHSGLTGLGNLDEKVITSLGKASGNIIGSSGKAFEHVSRGAGGFFYDVLGGLSGSLLWGALLLLGLFCGYQYITNQHNCFQQPDMTTSASHDEIANSTLDITEHNECVDCGLPRCPSIPDQLSQAKAV